MHPNGDHSNIIYNHLQYCNYLKSDNDEKEKQEKESIYTINNFKEIAECILSVFFDSDINPDSNTVEENRKKHDVYLDYLVVVFSLAKFYSTKFYSIDKADVNYYNKIKEIFNKIAKDIKKQTNESNLANIELIDEDNCKLIKNFIVENDKEKPSTNQYAVLKPSVNDNLICIIDNKHSIEQLLHNLYKYWFNLNAKNNNQVLKHPYETMQQLLKFTPKINKQKKLYQSVIQTVNEFFKEQIDNFSGPNTNSIYPILNQDSLQNIIDCMKLENRESRIQRGDAIINSLKNNGQIEQKLN